MIESAGNTENCESVRYQTLCQLELDRKIAAHVFKQQCDRQPLTELSRPHQAGMTRDIDWPQKVMETIRKVESCQSHILGFICHQIAVVLAGLISELL